MLLFSCHTKEENNTSTLERTPERTPEKTPEKNGKKLKKNKKVKEWKQSGKVRYKPDNNRNALYSRICPFSQPGPEVIKLFFMLNSVEHEIYPVHICIY